MLKKRCLLGRLGVGDRLGSSSTGLANLSLLKPHPNRRQRHLHSLGLRLRLWEVVEHNTHQPLTKALFCATSSVITVNSVMSWGNLLWMVLPSVDPVYNGANKTWQEPMAVALISYFTLWFHKQPLFASDSLLLPLAWVSRDCLYAFHYIRFSSIYYYFIIENTYNNNICNPIIALL